MPSDQQFSSNLDFLVKVMIHRGLGIYSLNQTRYITRMRDTPESLSVATGS